MNQKTIPPEFEVFIHKFIDLKGQIEKLPDHPVKFLAITRLEEMIEEFEDYEEDDEGYRLEGGGKMNKDLINIFKELEGKYKK